MKRRFRHSAVLFCAMVLVVVLLAGISPASYAAPLNKIAGMSGKGSVLAEKAAMKPDTLSVINGGRSGDIEGADDAEAAEAPEEAEETPLKDRQLKDEVMKEAVEASETAEAPGQTVLPAKPEKTPVPKVSMADILKANDPELLLQRHAGYGYIQDTYSEYGLYDENLTAYLTDSFLYIEYPGDGCDLDSYDWYDFDWDLIEDWDDWSDFGTADWDGYDSWDGFDECFGCEPASGILYTEKNRYQLVKYFDGESNFSIDWAAFPDEEQQYEPERLFPTLDPQSTLAERIVDVRMENGMLIVTTIGDAPAFCEISPLSDEIGSLLTYYLDPDTLEIQYLDCAVLLADGCTIPFMSQTALYDAPDSDLFREMADRAAAYENESFANPRTVTVIYDPGTDGETVCSRTSEKGDYLLTTFMDGYLLYEDKARTVPFTGSDASSDLLIYAFRDDGTYNYDVFPQQEDDADALPADEALQAIVNSGTPIEDAEVPAEIEESCGPDSVPAVEESPVDSVILDVAEELDYAELSDLVYEANKLDMIFRNHDSVEYSMLFDEELLPNRIDYIYETPHTAYSESHNSAFYATRDSFYQMWLDGNASDLYYTFDFVNDFDPHRNAGYEIVPSSSGQWWNPDCETPLYAYSADGVIYMGSEYDEDLSRAFFAEWLAEEYDGQTVSPLLIVDPDSYEILAMAYTVTDRDGQESSPLIISVNYDVPEPRASRNMRAIAERSAEYTAELTIVMNPGTDSEKIESMKVPIGSTVIYVANSNMTLYADEDGTVPASRWDHVSDNVYYLIAD